MKKLATLVAATVALTLPAAAAAKNVKHEGFIVGDKAASIKLRVKASGGKATKVSGFRAKNVAARCDRDTVRIQLTALAPVKVKRDQSFKVRLGDGDGGILRISGKVKRDGRATVGNLKTNVFDQGDLSCKVSKQKFKTSAK